MYGRRRGGGGKGYRSNPMGIGAAVPRSSPDGPARGGFYNSGYRNFNRGFGRGRPKNFQSPQMLGKGDLFMEAGRLAAEYLVAKGMLPPNALPSKFQNGGFRKEVGEYREFKQRDGEDMQIPLDSRPSALARLGSFDGGSDRKRFQNDNSTEGSKQNLRGRRKTGSFNSYDSDRGQENGKSGSISGRSRASSDKEADDDALSVHLDDHLGTNDAVDDEQNLKDAELAPKSDGSGTSQTEADMYQPVTNLSLKTSSSAAAKDCQHATDMECDKESDDFGNLNVEDGEMKDSKDDEEIGKHNPLEDSVIQPNHVVETRASKKRNDWLQLCDFSNTPTRPRSLRSRGSKGNLCATIEEGNTSAGTSPVVGVESINSDGIDKSLVNASLEETPMIEGHTDIGTPVDPEVLVDDNVVGVSESSALSDQNLDLMTNKIMSVENSDQSLGNLILLGHDTSLSYPDRSLACTDDCSQGPLGSKVRVSVDEFVADQRGEKRVLDESDTGRTYKKPKAWSPSMINQADEYPHLSNLSTVEPTLIERTSPTHNRMMIGQEGSSHVSGFATLEHGDPIGYAEDKQIIDSSFKICDLNLMDGSDLNENHDGSQMMFFSSITEIKKEPLPVNGGLTMRDNSNMSHNYTTIGSNGKEVEIIDLDNDFAGDRAFDSEDKREEAVYTGLESFPTRARNNTNGTDVQDGYGLMISELLGNEIPTCSTVAGDINSLHGDMDLHNEQGMLPEDDPIYMTLGEIPIGFWEPPNPEYGNPFEPK
ncbi:unnamed protein product [Rhodiola kirilowii]